MANKFKRGETPTLTFKFPITQVSDIDKFRFTITQEHKIKLEKEIDEVEFNEELNTVNISLSEKETLMLKGDSFIQTQCRWGTGTVRKVGQRVNFYVEDIESDGEL